MFFLEVAVLFYSGDLCFNLLTNLIVYLLGFVDGVLGSFLYRLAVKPVAGIFFDGICVFASYPNCTNDEQGPAENINYNRKGTN